MNDNEKVLTVPAEKVFEPKSLEGALIQKLIAKKWLIARKAFFFTFGFVFYLIYSTI